MSMSIRFKETPVSFVAQLVQHPMSFFSNIQQQLQQTTSQLTESFNSLNLQDTATQIKSNIESEVSKVNSNLKPIIARTQRQIQEKIGANIDISELPQEYKDLENRVDEILKFYKKVLEITRTYEIESYDYPNHIKENVIDYGKLINEKISELSKANSTSEAEKVLLSGRKDRTPVTFAHTFATKLNSVNIDGSLGEAIKKISEIEIKIGNERLEQDNLIINEFNKKIEDLIKVEFQKCYELREKVLDARLNFDTVRAEIKANGETEELNKKLEEKEDELVSATEVAVESMKELIKPLDSINLMKILFKIQLNYHKNVATQLEGLIDSLEGVEVDED
ncbi:hypothetical protein CANINC_000672 [Pichia inconspicua]|uniref:BAR domain-containing protein n=1 Tax=Pichia inconspicua TaxID=52247 RepID=A0A4T0X5K5_9ASCO|nr:hypothetical protein CANINC_000672 [[Candida] inconspicua]